MDYSKPTQEQKDKHECNIKTIAIKKKNIEKYKNIIKKVLLDKKLLRHVKRDAINEAKAMIVIEERELKNKSNQIEDYLSYFA